LLDSLPEGWLVVCRSILERFFDGKIILESEMELLGLLNHEGAGAMCKLELS
jgi:hypothetical protein